MGKGTYAYYWVATPKERMGRERAWAKSGKEMRCVSKKGGKAAFTRWEGERAAA